MIHDEPSKLDDYLDLHSTDIPKYLIDLERETGLKVIKPAMLSGRMQGRFLSFISKSLRPDRILEIGTFTGYSALCIAEGLNENGKLHSIEINDELQAFHEKYISNGKFSEKIEIHYGDAKELLSSSFEKEYFDLIFIDADKESYPKYLKLSETLLKSNGILIADNVLWFHKVLDISIQDPETNAVREFNENLRNNPNFESLILPVRDGLTLARKK